ncbi:MAG: phosphoribosylaminoimidazolesuccinocarboxamide synthase [Actinobacteria bacterium]|nr:phosphoribosylaminoimidazolesuccinocarboxamide synthase [Actinomycetota bacterium]
MSSPNHTAQVLTNINCPNLKLFKEGKVRSVFDLGEQLLIVASDRVSAFDVILNEGIPQKAAVLTQISEFWFSQLGDICEHHLISTNVRDFPEECQEYAEQLEGRSMLVKKTDLIEVECVVRGYLVGSGWKDYQNTGKVCGHQLPEGLQLADPLPEPIFTPATKATSGHDENISIDQMKTAIGETLTNQLMDISMKIYEYGRKTAEEKGIILADTKFEFGLLDGKIILIDEVLTPDSSRYWAKSEYQPGISPPSYDKQIVRDHLDQSDWNKQAPAPSLPEHIITKASDKYLEIQDLLVS